jgi:ATP-binding protein involved in chromosome partitioning
MSTNQPAPSVSFGSTPPLKLLSGVKNIIAVASGKGGVGKSTVAVNLALVLAQTGASVGLLDTDIYGPSLPLMMGICERPTGDPRTGLLTPLEKHGLRLMSMGFISDEKTAVIWRGPMVHKMITTFMAQVDWGTLDYLVMDLPPGTGDAQLTITQTAPLTGAVIVTTPQDVSLIDARKGLLMFQQVNVPVLGIVENMSYFVCDECGKRHEIFRYGGGRRASEELGVPFLGEVPLDPKVTWGGDQGAPVVTSAPDSPASQALREVARKLIAQLEATAAQRAPLPTLDLTGIGK